MIYVLKVAYEGSPFAGLQRQPGQDTVQGHLEAALSRFFGKAVKTSVAGRTDTGVNALAQVVSFQHHSLCDLKRLAHGLNAMARAPVAVLEAAVLDDDTNFHPRHSALSRSYRYLILDDCCYTQRLFWSGRAWCVGGKLDLEKMREAAKMFIGEHDFSTFAYHPDEDMSRIRRVLSIEYAEEALAPGFFGAVDKGRLWRMEVTGNAFLRRMVRALASALVRVGLGLESPAELKEKFLANDARLGPPPAPAQGLYFLHVHYSPDPFELAKQQERYFRATPSLSLNFQGQGGRLN